MLPAYAGCIIASVTLARERYFLVTTISIGAGLVTFAIESAALWVRLLPWFVGLVMLTVLPWLRPLRERYHLAVRTALTLTTLCLVIYICFLLVGVHTDDAIALIWVAWLSATLTCFLVSYTTERRWPYIAAVGVQAHMIHAVLALGFVRPVPVFFVSLPLAAFYGITPLLLFCTMARAANSDDADALMEDTAWMSPHKVSGWRAGKDAKAPPEKLVVDTSYPKL